jgi:phage I-like protein
MSSDTITSLAASAPVPVLAAHAVALAAEPPEWVQLLPIGTVQARDGRGPYTIADTAHAERVIAASREFLGTSRPVVDYDHQTDLAAVPGVGGTAPAAGWIEDLEVRPDGIWGRVEWTAQAAERIRSREYRFISPVFSHTRDGQVLALLRAGLTNKPNLDLLALASAHTQEDHMEELLKRLRKLFGLPEDATADAVVAHCSTLAAGLTQARTTLGRIAEAAGVPADAGTDQVLTAINAARTVDPARFVPMDQYTTVCSQLATLQQQAAGEKAAAAVDQAIKDGKLIPAQRDWALSYASSDLDAFGRFVAAQPVIVAPGTVVPEGKPGGGGSALDDEEKAICAQLGLSEADYLKTRGA